MVIPINLDMPILNTVTFAPDSVIDPFGRVFFYNDQVYRAINNDSEKICMELLNSDLFKELVELHYIPKTWIDNDIKIEGSPLILHHEKCTIIKPYEWTFEAYKDASIFILKLNKKCNEYGYELKDAHPFNVTFHKGEPLWFDIGSITKKEFNNDWIAKNEFIETCLIPLMLWRDNDYYLLRAILESDDIYYQRNFPYQSALNNPYLFKKISHLEQHYLIHGKWSIKTSRHFPSTIFRALDRIVAILKKKDKNYHFFKEKIFYRIPTIEELLRITCKRDKTEWEDYCPSLNIADIEKEFPRFKIINDIISEKCSDARSILDIAGNSGQLAVYLNLIKKYETTFVVDNDEHALTKGYSFFKKNHIPINTVWTNCIFMPNFPLDSKRLKSDIVFALAITHHLILRQHIPLQLIFERIKKLSNKYVVIEFMPLGLWDGNSSPETPQWYTIEWFHNLFLNHFDLLHIQETETNRVLFLGTIKQ